jgi:release factor glutamine methyltransferase
VALTDIGKLEPEVRDFEPKEALFAGEDGLDFYKKLVPVISELIEKRGKIFLEIGYNQSNALNKTFENGNYNVQFKRDYNQIERILILEGKN